MISRETLKDLCRRSGFHLYQQEKDYLIKLFLYNYFRRYDGAVFKGGTCLRYLYGTGRFSEDIDFNITIGPSGFREQVGSTLREIEAVGIDNGFLKEELFRDAYTCEIWFHGPLHRGTEQTRNKLRIDAGKRGGMLRAPRWELIPSEYPETREQFLVQTMDEEELLAEKVRTMLDRRKGRDMYDVWFLLKKNVRFDPKLMGRKGGRRFDASLLPSKREYERDMKKLITRTIPYEQVKKELKVRLQGN
jgi:predicted nucleotidyltransferase component of viral defense system